MGRTLLPSLSRNNVVGAAQGAVVLPETMNRLAAGGDGVVDFVLVDVRADRRCRGSPRRYRTIATVSGASQPGDIRSYDRVPRETPLVLAGLLAFLGVAVLAHLLVTSVRARRNDLAILKSLGFTAGRYRRASRGRRLRWPPPRSSSVSRSGDRGPARVGRVPDQLRGDRAPDRGAVRGLSAIAITTFLLANAIAAVPAQRAARTRPASVLASE